jgi:hypothetical protein
MRYMPEDSVAGNVTVNGTLDVNGGFQLAVTAQSASYTALTSDEVILVTSGASAKTVTLVTAVGNAGRTYVVKKVDSGAGAVTVQAASGNIDSSATYSLATQNKYVRVVSDGTNYFVIANN